MSIRRPVVLLTAAVTTLACLAAAAKADGGDVVLQSIGSTTASSPVNGVRGYALGSSTCNIGNQNIAWTNNSTPGLGMNAFRLHDGRLEQIGMSWCKLACCAAAGGGCGLSCNGQGGNVLGAGCLDVYGAGWNSSQGRMGPRSQINAFTGLFTTTGGGSIPTAVDRLLQIRQTDLTLTNFPNARYFVEGVYVSTEDAIAGNWANNATYQAVSVSQSTFALTLTGSVFAQQPAIRAWRDHGLGVNQPDTSVTLGEVDVPGEGRFHYAYKVRANGDGTWTYDYAIYNLSSDRSGGSLTIPVPEGVTVTGIGFHDVDYHSGEPYDNTDWPSARDAAAVSWSCPQTFAENANTNALRWGTMYNFWFTANRPPIDNRGVMGLFKPGTPNEVAMVVLAPDRCRGDYNGLGGVTVQDVFDYLADYFSGHPRANIDGQNGVTLQDLFDYLGRFFGPC